MAGQVKKMLDLIILKRSNGNPVLETTTKTKLIMKGLNPEKFTISSPDDPAIVAKVKALAGELGISL
jgi:hypothetical protein